MAYFEASFRLLDTSAEVKQRLIGFKISSACNGGSCFLLSAFSFKAMICAFSTFNRISVDVMKPLNAGTGMETCKALFLDRNYNKNYKYVYFSIELSSII